jgi:dolichyl-phosphate-mannose--protein O-mannosyl transferase
MDLFSPLPKEYCVYFYFLSIIGFTLMSIAIVFGAISAFKNKKIGNIGQLFMIVIGYFIFYFQNRLLYGMCMPGNSASAAREGLVGGNVAKKTKEGFNIKDLSINKLF